MALSRQIRRYRRIAGVGVMTGIAVLAVSQVAYGQGSPPTSAPAATGPGSGAAGQSPAPKTASPLPLDTQFSWGGYIKLDLMYSTSSTGTPSSITDYAIIPGAIAVPSPDDNSNFNLTARESRFWLKTSTPSAYGDIKTHIEVDFVGFDANLGNERTSNSSSPRLRHAYGSWQGILAGQYWSTWMDLQALPEKNDFGSPAGRIFARQAQIRYTLPIDSLGGELQVAVENPETALTAPDDTADGTRVVPTDDIAPDTVVKVTTTGTWGHVAVAGIARAIRSDLPITVPDGDPETNDTTITVDDVQVGFGAHVSGKIMLGAKHNLRFDASYGQGIGRYIGFNAFNDGSANAQGNIELIDLVAGILSAQIWLSDTLRINLTGSASQALNNADNLPGATKQIISSHSNVMWNAAKSVRLGLEHIFIQRSLEDDTSGALHRIQFAARYTF